MKNIPDGQLIRVQPSPLYIGEIYSSNMPTMDEITRLAMPKPRNDYTLYHGNPTTYPKTKIYKPLLLASNAPDIPTESNDDNEQKTLGDCVWECIKKQFGFDLVIPGVTGAAVVGSSNIPKSWVNMPSESLKSGGRTSVLSLIQHKKNMENKGSPKVGKRKVIRELYFKKERFLTRKGLDRITREVGTRGTFRFAGRFIPWIGWGLLAFDVAMISKCSYDCYNSDDNPPMS